MQKPRACRVTLKQLSAERFLNLPRPTRAPPAPRATRPGGASECRARAFVVCVSSLTQRNHRGARCAPCRLRKPRADSRRGAWPSRRRIRKHTSRRTRRPVSLASRHTLAGGLAFCVAAQGHAARRRLSERYLKRLARSAHRFAQAAAEVGDEVAVQP